MRTQALFASFLVCAASAFAQPSQNLIDYFRPMPITAPLTSEAWGLPGVLPRDVNNGLEDKSNQHWSYWDGKILKGQDGRFHLFASRWPEQAGTTPGAAPSPSTR